MAPYGVRQQPASERALREGAARPYRADAFTLDLRPGWRDRTVFVLEGPHAHEFQHVLTVNVDTEVDDDMALLDYADLQVANQLDTLRGCRLLKKGYTKLDNGLTAYRAVFVWYPAEDRRIYRDQLFVLHRGTAYTMAASFTKKTRKTLGPRVTRAMHSFEPVGTG